MVGILIRPRPGQPTNGDSVTDRSKKFLLYSPKSVQTGSEAHYILLNESRGGFSGGKVAGV